MKNVIGFLLSLLLLVSCGEMDEKEYYLEGAWALTHVAYPTELTIDYPYRGMTYLNIYDGDSVLYVCQLFYTGSGIVVAPLQTIQVSLIRLAPNEQLYMEDGDPHPLVIKSDSVITIQRSGVISTWVRASDMTEGRINEIREIIKNDQKNDANEAVRHYVLSTTERKLLSANHRLLYALITALVCMLVAVQIAITKHQRVKRADRRLREIEEERELRPQPVRMALKAVEQEFLESGYYRSIHRFIAEGKRMKAEDWEELERQLNVVYPSFTNHLFSLYPMSELEYQVSLLIKLRISPSDMANVLARDISTISSTRSRLYQKVFHRKGSSREWDDFVLSIGS